MWAASRVRVDMESGYSDGSMSATRTSTEACLSCGASFNGRYCSSCGERAVHPGDMRLGHLTHDFLHELTDLDGKIWRTIRALLFEPGRLTAEYWAGRRGPWVKPLRIYLIVTALQLLLAANASGPMGLRVWVNRAANGEPNYTVGQVPTGSVQSPVAEELNRRIQSVYLWDRYLSLGLFAACSLLINRKLQPHYGAHLIFALHYYSFESIIAGLMVRIAPNASPLIPVGIGYVYLFFALRKIYRRKFFATFAVTIGLFTAVAVSEAIVVAGTVLAVAKLWHTG